MHFYPEKAYVEQLTITEVTTAFTSPLCAIVSSANLLEMPSMCLNLPFSASMTARSEIIKLTLYPTVGTID